MPQVIVTAGAVTGLSRCRSFLEDNSPSTVIISGAVIEHYFQVLESEPEIGRPCEDNPDWRELLIPFSSLAMSHGIFTMAAPFMSWPFDIKKKQAIRNMK